MRLRDLVSPWDPLRLLIGIGGIAVAQDVLSLLIVLLTLIHLAWRFRREVHKARKEDAAV